MFEHEEEEEEEEEEEDEDEEEDVDEIDEIENEESQNQNPCGCLRGKKCYFINALQQIKLVDNDVEKVNEKISQMLQLKCINAAETGCCSLFYPFCVEVRNKKNNQVEKRLLTKCKNCFDNSIKTTDAIFQILTRKQE